MKLLQARSHNGLRCQKRSYGSPLGPALQAVFAVFLFTQAPSALADDDEGFNFDLGGRLQIDGATFDSDNPVFEDDAGVRRARLKLTLGFPDGFRARIQYDYDGKDIVPKSIWMRYDFDGPAEVTVGHFKQPFSLQNATSSRYNTFMERALPNVFAPSYQLGAMASAYGERWSVSGGITAGSLNDDFSIREEGTAVFARGVINPVRSKDHVLHLGLSIESRQFDGTETLTWSAKPESNMSAVKMVDTGEVTGLSDSLSYALELAWMRNRLNLQAEHFGTDVGLSGTDDLSFDGWYAQAGLFLSNDSRRYVRKKGRYKAVKPDSRFGAWEIAVRVSEIDLSSPALEGRLDMLGLPMPAGGKQSNTTFALNWYITDSLRLAVNYIEAEADPNGFGLPDEVSIIQARFQYTF